MFLQAQSINSLPTEKKMISLWEIFFSGGILGNAVIVTILIMGIIMLYIYFERSFLIKRESKEDADFLETIKDCIHEGRIEAALDLCESTDSPESRVIKKGLQRIGRPIADISGAMQNQGQTEVALLEQNLSVLSSISGAAPMLGFLGTVIGMLLSFLKMSATSGVLSPKLLTEGLYTALSATIAGLIIGIIAYILYNVLVTRISQFIVKLQTQSNDFLDALNKPL